MAAQIPRFTFFLIAFFLLILLFALHAQREYIKKALARGDSHQNTVQERVTVVEKCPTKERHYIAKHHEPKGLAPCGEICTYEGKITNRTDFYPEIIKPVDCENIMRRMAYKEHEIVFPPPEYPPPDLYDEFTMFGEMPIRMYQYYKGSDKEVDFKTHSSLFGKKDIDEYLDMLDKGESLNPYDNGRCAQDVLKKYIDTIKGKRGVVIGTLAPWLEAILLGFGASHVTTLEYSDIKYDHPQLDSYTPYDFAEKYLRGEIEKFDFAASFSSIEHAGLGRYTDPINPYGDLEAMAQVWCMVKPGGAMGLGVRANWDKNFITWNVDRIYGDARLQHLTANWKVHEKVQCMPHVMVMLTRIDQ